MSYHIYVLDTNFDSMAIKFKDGVIIGADSRTTTGGWTILVWDIRKLTQLQLTLPTESPISLHKFMKKYGVVEVVLPRTPRPLRTWFTITSNSIRMLNSLFDSTDKL